MTGQDQFENEKESTSSHQSRVIRRGASETDTWAMEGSILGLIVGLVVGIGVSMMIKMGSQPPQSEEMARAIPFFILAIPPVIGAIFGVSAGTLVGVGTPKPKPFPEQGRVMWRPFMKRRPLTPQRQAH